MLWERDCFRNKTKGLCEEAVKHGCGCKWWGGAPDVGAGWEAGCISDGRWAAGSQGVWGHNFECNQAYEKQMEDLRWVVDHRTETGLEMFNEIVDRVKSHLDSSEPAPARSRAASAPASAPVPAPVPRLRPQPVSWWKRLCSPHAALRKSKRKSKRRKSKRRKSKRKSKRRKSKRRKSKTRKRRR